MITARMVRVLLSMLVMFMFGSSAQAQAGDWQAVMNLKSGTLISVKARHRVRCRFELASPDELVCKPPQFFHIGPSKITIDRQSVREVRLAHSDGPNVGVGMAIGAGVGAVAGAASGGAGVLIFTPFGAAVGAVVGSGFHILHDKVIYRQ